MTTPQKQKKKPATTTKKFELDIRDYSTEWNESVISKIQKIKQRCSTIRKQWQTPLNRKRIIRSLKSKEEMTSLLDRLTTQVESLEKEFDVLFVDAEKISDNNAVLLESMLDLIRRQYSTIVMHADNVIDEQNASRKPFCYDRDPIIQKNIKHNPFL
jgi:hypothetical protein